MGTANLDLFYYTLDKAHRLAKRMISLSGLKLGEDIEIAYTGLRPGEKLYEELLNVKENIIETHNPKILKANINAYPFEYASDNIQNIIRNFHKKDVVNAVASMKQLMPEFISNNSVYEKLDAVNSH